MQVIPPQLSVAVTKTQPAAPSVKRRPIIVIIIIITVIAMEASFWASFSRGSNLEAEQVKTFRAYSSSTSADAKAVIKAAIHSSD